GTTSPVAPSLAIAGFLHSTDGLLTSTPSDRRRYALILEVAWPSGGDSAQKRALPPSVPVNRSSRPESRREPIEGGYPSSGPNGAQLPRGDETGDNVLTRLQESMHVCQG